jgi:hypothetical protein
MAALMPLPATPSSYIQPPTPIMGGLLQSTYGEFEPWTGRGRPLYDWSGLDMTWVTKSKSPNQLHPTSLSGAQKSYNYCQKGLKTSFDRGSDFVCLPDCPLEEAPGYRLGHHYLHAAS